MMIKNIPQRSFEYLVNGRSPLEWIIDRYHVKIDSASGIENNTNDFDYNLSTKLVAPTDQFFMKSDDGTILDLTPFNP